MGFLENFEEKHAEIMPVATSAHGREKQDHWKHFVVDGSAKGTHQDV